MMTKEATWTDYMVISIITIDKGMSPLCIIIITMEKPLCNDVSNCAVFCMM